MARRLLTEKAFAWGSATRRTTARTSPSSRRPGTSRRDDSFDVVFCDYGAMTFVDAYLTVPEAARILKPGGIFVFSATGPTYIVCASTS